MLGRPLFCLVVVLGAVSAFHLQNQPGMAERLCTGRVRSICSRYGMRCRANQAFDADLPHAVCDQMNSRTAGIRPEILLQRGSFGGGGGGGSGSFGGRQSFGNRFQTRGWSSRGSPGQWETGML